MDSREHGARTFRRRDPSMSSPDRSVAIVADRVEQTMRRLKVWTVPPPMLPFRQPFAMDAMPFEHWIQLVLVPRLREVASGAQPMPPSSNLAAHAVREFDGRDEMNPLVDALRDVDGLSKSVAGPPPTPRMPAFSMIMGLANLGTIFGVVFSIYVSQWVSRSLAPYFLPRVSTVLFGDIAPDERHSVLRLALDADVGSDQVLKFNNASILLNSNSIPRPGVLITLPEPLSFDPAAPPGAAVIRDWLVHAGVDAGSAGARPAAAQVLDLLEVAVATRTRDGLEDLVPSLPAGTPEPQIVDIDAHTPGWIEMTAGIVAALVFCVPFLVFAYRTARRRRLMGR